MSVNALKPLEGRWFRGTLACLAIILGLFFGCDRTGTKGGGSDAGAPLFKEVTTEKGLPGPTPNWPDGTYATPETTAGGVAFLDYDNDGQLDILQICHGRPGHLDETVPNRLFHQEVNGSFREVPNAGGLKSFGYAHGVAVGDYDNDGFPDVYITAFGHNALYHNNGNGTFTDVTKRAGLALDQPIWSSSATFVDYDRDGLLDLLVVRFAEFDAGRVCPGDDGKRDYCGPSNFKGIGVSLYHNNGDGTFTDVTQKAGVTYPGRGWGVVCADLTGDGWVDFYIANDEERQNLYVNQHDGTFKDEAIERGVAFSGMGRAEAGMGVTVGDVLNNGRLSLFITHFRNEKNTLYMPREDGTFADKSAAGGMAQFDLPYTGWGCGCFDFDNDGNLDVAVVNGRVSRGTPLPGAHLTPFWNLYAEPNLLFRGDGNGHFSDVTSRAGDFTAHIESTRGLAFGSISNDGRVDLLTNSVDNTLHLYKNVAPADGNHWLMLRALTAKRDALGAQVEISAGGRKWTRPIFAGYSYCSSNDPRAHFGLGKADKIDANDILWPDGKRERFPGGAVDRVLTITQGSGQPAGEKL